MPPQPPKKTVKNGASEGVGEGGTVNVLVGCGKKKKKQTKKPSTPKTKKIPKDKVRYDPNKKTNLVTRKNNILKKLQNTFKDNPHVRLESLVDAKYLYVNGEYREYNDGVNIFYFDDHGLVSIAIFKSILSEELVLKLEQLFFEARGLRLKESDSKKRTIYTGVWAKNNPMNYITKNNDAPSGQFITNKILPLLSPIASKFLQIVHPDTYESFKKLPKTAKINDELFPSSATNFLEPKMDHRIKDVHQDGDDLKMTMIFTFGLSAPLVFPNQNTSFRTQRGDLVMFMGCNYSHYVDASNLNESSTSSGNQYSKFMRTSFVLFGHKSLKEKPIYHLTKKLALEQFDLEYPEEAEKRRQRREENRAKKAKKRAEQDEEEESD